MALVFCVPPVLPAPLGTGSAHTQNSPFSELRFRFRAYTLHLVTLAYLPLQLAPSGHYTSERLTTPYSGKLLCFRISFTVGKHCQVSPESGWQPVIIGSFIARPSPTNGSLSARTHTPLANRVYCAASLRLRCHPIRALSPAVVSPARPSLYREPLCLRVGVTSAQHGIATRVSEHYLALIARIGSCARPKSSHFLGVTLVP